MPTRYDRIPSTIDSPRDKNINSNVNSQMVPIEDVPKSRRNPKKLKRRGSGSYESIGSDEQDFCYDQNQIEDGDDEEHSPLHNQRSYASDDEDRDNDYPSTFPVSPRAMYPSFSNSFDLDDDDDDDILEANLKRYNLDFTATDKGASLGEIGMDDRASNNRCTRAARFLWYSFQSVRQQARQRRAQLLLQQTERNWKQSLKICILTNCDATDSGILLVAVTTVLWILVLVLVKDAAFRRIGIILGLLCFAIRVGTRPLYHCFLKQRQKRQLRRQQDQLDNRSSDIHSEHSDGTLELHAIRGESNNHPNRLPATSVGSDPTIAAI